MNNDWVSRWPACILGTAWFAVAALADAPELSPADLEQQAQTELAMVSRAVQDRLEHEAAGDALGARVAAKDAENHRDRFLDLKREIARLSPSPPTRPSVGAARSPFTADESVSQVSGLPHQPVAASADATVQRSRGSYSLWDMYRPREVRQAGDASGAPDEGRAARAGADQQADQSAGGHAFTGWARASSGMSEAVGLVPAGQTDSGDVPRAPLRIYREGSQAHARDQASRVTDGEASSGSLTK